MKCSYKYPIFIVVICGILIMKKTTNKAIIHLQIGTTFALFFGRVFQVNCSNKNFTMQCFLLD